MTTIATRQIIRDASEGRVIPAPRPHDRAWLRGLRFAVTRALACTALWGLMSLILYTYATSGGNW